MDWIWHIAVTKVAKRIIQLIVSWLIAQNLQRFGVHFDSNQLTIAIYGAVELGRNWIKQKFNVKWL